MSARFFSPEPLTPGEFVLEGPEAHHLTTVRRCTTGERVVLFNGDGCDYPADVVALSRKSVVLHIVAREATHRELPYSLEIAAAMPKGDRGDFLIEKLVELGVSRFTPLETARTIVAPKAARLENLRQAVIEASKQCGRNVLMTIGPLTRWPTFVAGADLPPTRVLLAPEASRPLSEIAVTASGIVVAIGPEGGWDASERESASGWIEASLGARVLRIETAAITAAAVLGMTRG